MTDRVGQRFAAAAGRYSEHARAQAEAAQAFDAWLALQAGAAAPRRIVELGCGTGFLTERLRRRHPGARLLATDIAPGMVAQCRARLGGGEGLEFAVCDARRAAFEQADWLVSSFCFQWFDDLPQVLAQLLPQARVLAFSVPMDGSFAGWRDAHHAAGLECGLRQLPRWDDLRAACDALGARRVVAERITIDEPHADGLSFARALRAIGADTPRPDHRPVPLRAVLRAMEEGGYTANYEVGFFWIER
ncbi:methyltransferase domain-containing protein [Caldimonas tepidiphila]|uniref:methyltransferase domain-containing protein n=1 Tax=Caldimonas tepidiphila TaxID=2315841 RepID=UPI000E5BC87D|nr:methyltransferase domain-containing protein [Caldimonas tepidiphila]